LTSTREDGQPAILFYVQDWLCEPTLKVVSMGAKGLWIDVLCLMARSPVKGYLLTPAGEPADIDWIGKQIGRPVPEIAPLWDELLRAQTPRVDSKNRIFSKRMVDDKTLTEKRSEAGRLGGRPKSKRKANGKQNENGETSLDNDNDNETDVVVNQKCLLSVVVEAWNALPKPFPKVVALSKGRRSHLTARLKEPNWVANWRAALDKVRTSAFCQGKNDRGWVADFDFFIRPDSVAKCLEGKYDKRKTALDRWADGDGEG
jgi:hypothetical protein